MNWNDLEYFTEHEFKCRCGCGHAPMDRAFLKALDAIRAEYGKPMKISSGYRCAHHPVEARKAQPGTGAHSTGKACDVVVAGSAAFELLGIIVDKIEITGIGVNQRGAWDQRFLHIDTVEAGAGSVLNRPNVWSY
jgi:zinc D-Ala-D-Ala carboxypeptidase